MALRHAASEHLDIWSVLFVANHDVDLTNVVAQSCPTLCDPMDCSPPGSSVHEIFQARILEWIAILFSRGSSQPKDGTWVSCIGARFFTFEATREVLTNIKKYINKH